MAFLDNSGDIILDAVLTETGRRRMAQGNFKIVKFAFGDDEIDYSLYDKDNTGGPAYYDLEILQTPVGEARLQLNYGLIASLPTDILYMPTLQLNELGLLNSITSNSGMFYVTDASGDISSATISAWLDTDSIGYMKGTAVPNANYILLESGLSVAFGTTPMGTKPNQRSYLVTNGLVDKSYYVFYDNRFFSGILGPGAKSTFANSGRNHELVSNITLTSGQRTTMGIGLDDYSSSRVKGISNQIYYYGDGNDTEESYSVIGGPRATALAISPVVKEGLQPEYTKYGFTSKSGVVTSGNVDYIDTTLYVVGASTGTTAQMGVRIIRRS